MTSSINFSIHGSLRKTVKDNVIMIQPLRSILPLYIASLAPKDDQNTSISHLSSLVCVDDVLGECLANPNANDYYRIPAAMNGQSEQPLTPTPPQPITTAPKHWHGSFGDRYEHHNVWVRGGQSQYYPARRSSSFSSSSTASNSSDSPSMSDRGVHFSLSPFQIDHPKQGNQTN